MSKKAQLNRQSHFCCWLLGSIMPFNINLSHQKLFKRDLFTAKVACWKAIRISIRPMSGKTPILTKLVMLLQITSPSHCTPYPPPFAAPQTQPYLCLPHLGFWTTILPSGKGNQKWFEVFTFHKHFGHFGSHFGFKMNFSHPLAL